MKKALTIIFFLWSLTAISQQFADKEFYLVDSLDLNLISKADKVLLDTNLKRFHAADHDTSKFAALDIIVSNMIDEQWEQYQDFYHDYLLSETVINHSIKSQKSIYHHLGWSFLNLGYIARYDGDILKSLENYQMGLRIGTLGKFLDLQATCLNNIAIIYMGQEINYKAEQYFARCLKIRETLDEPFSLAMIYNNLGQLRRDEEDYDSSLVLLQKAKEYIMETEVDFTQALILGNLGTTHRKLGNMDSASYYLDMSLSILHDHSASAQKAICYSNLAWVELSRNNHAEAIRYGEAGLEMAQQIRSPNHIRVAAEALSDIYATVGRDGDALEMYKLTVSMRDSTRNVHSQNALALQEAQYDYEIKSTVDQAEHEYHLNIKEEEKQNSKILNYMTGGVLFLVAGFLFFVFNRLKLTRKQRNEIQQQKEHIEEVHSEIQDSIVYAKRIQTAILPPDSLFQSILPNSFVLYLPKDVVAGDFYWLHETGNMKFFAAADCTGHGVPGAMVSVVCNSALNRSVKEFGCTEPHDILEKVREIVLEEFSKSEEQVKDGMDIALCSLDGTTLKYAGAHNPLWIIRSGSTEVEEIPADRQPIGNYERPVPFTLKSTELQAGDTLYIFSDGFADQFGGEKGKKLKPKNLKKILLEVVQLPIEEQSAALEKHFQNWRGEHEQIDDVCLIGVRI